MKPSTYHGQYKYKVVQTSHDITVCVIEWEITLASSELVEAVIY